MTAADTDPSASPTDAPGPVPGAAAIDRAVDGVRGGAADGVLRSVAARQSALLGLRGLLTTEADALAAALHHDLGLSTTEAHLTEIGPVFAEIEHALDRIEVWTRPRRFGLPFVLRPGHARGYVRPKGAVLVLAPSSSPVQQLLAPLATALAAGNTAVLAPSAATTATATLIARRLGDHLPAAAVQMVQGGAAVGAALVERGFDHVVFSGRAATARTLRAELARGDTTMTSIVGSKSPAIVAPNADLAAAARHIAIGKFAKAGQSCVAPDYVLVPRRRHRAFIDAVTAAIRRLYGTTPHTSPDYGRIVSAEHVDRLAALVRAGGFQAVAVGGGADRDTRYVDPTVLSGTSHDAAVMHDEVFGPILPVLAYESLADAVRFVNARPQPLVAFALGRSREIGHVVRTVRTGAVIANQVLLPTPIPDAAAGGFAADRGEHGFRAMSTLVPVVRRRFAPEWALLSPPYRRGAGRTARRLF